MCLATEEHRYRYFDFVRRIARIAPHFGAFTDQIGD